MNTFLKRVVTQTCQCLGECEGGEIRSHIKHQLVNTCHITGECEGGEKTWKIVVRDELQADPN